MRKMLVADLLCGAGGSSTGCAQALASLGLEMDLTCLNHWDVAIATHTRNHPQARHYCQDIATVRPHVIVPEGYLDLLMASPTCTHHSIARGGKPTSDQQRSDPWHIITWLTELRVKRIIIENVWEFTKWGPVNARTGKPIKSREGEYFFAWIDTLKRLGFDPEWRKLNAADYGDATTRQRFILMARSDGKPVRWPMPTHAKVTDDATLFPGLKPWRPAKEIIDWSIKGKSIFNRKKPLAPKTLARIHAGAVKLNWPEPFLVILRNHMDGKSIDGPLPAVAANGQHIGIAEPVVVETAHGNSPNERDPNSRRARSADGPLGAVHAGGGNFAVAEPFVMATGSSGAPRGAGKAPLPTVTTGGAGTNDHPGCARPMLVEPFVMSRHGGGAPRPVETSPTPTQVAKHSHILIAPYYGSGSGETCTSSDLPLPSPTTKARFGMVVPVTHSDASSRARDVNSDQLPTITTANRGEQALVEGVAGYDILFRMLEPHELAAAMGFDGYEFTGTKTEQVKQVGNAVSVKKMKACVRSIMEDAVSPALTRPARKRTAA